MSVASKIEALRKLAERPGTEHEGAVARAMLEKLLGRDGQVDSSFDSALDVYRAYLRREISIDQFVESLGKIGFGTCPCGSRLNQNQKCDNWQRHSGNTKTEIRAKFSKGDRVIYNMHAYPENCPGRVAAYVKLKPENGTYPWAWLSIKFDHLKGARQVPIFDRDGWHLEQVVTEMVEV